MATSANNTFKLTGKYKFVSYTNDIQISLMISYHVNLVNGKTNDGVMK